MRAIATEVQCAVRTVSRIVAQVLAPVDVVAQFGEHPDVDEVDAHVRRVMQKGLDELAAKRRFPILG